LDSPKVGYNKPFSSMKILLFENAWELKENIILKNLKEESLNELILWNCYTGSKKNRKVRIKEYLKEIFLIFSF
jgi:hypothetical protein